MKLKHRNSQKRIYFEDAEYFVTCKTHNNYPFFKEKIFCDLFVENLRICKELKEFILYGWVLCLDHFHLLIRPENGCDISEIMHFLKRNVSRDCNFVMGDNKYDSPQIEGADHDPRLRRLNKIKWILKFRFKFKYLNQIPLPHFQWQKSYHDHYIRNENDWQYHMGYIACNPIKHELPNGWEYVFTNKKYDNF
ncbi:transposase [Patescibacteria group bacterium]|nr:transposase [Patescibacteria group bacterium]